MNKLKLLSKKLIAIIIGVIIVSTGAIYYGYMTFQNAQKEFVDDGYVLAEAGSKEKESYYFVKGDKYNQSYADKITFKDKEGSSVGVGTENFVHFMNNNMMSFSKGVFFDADQISDKNMFYYNISPSMVLSKNGDSYEIMNANNTIKMKNIIWKISDSKYMIISNQIELTFSKGNTKTIDDYIELSFIDKDVVYLSHQQGTYQTVSNDATIRLANGLVLNLADKSLYQEDKEVLSLAQMVVDADDNIEVIEKEETKTEKKDDQKDDVTTPGSGGSGGGSGNSSDNTGGGSSNGNGDSNNNGGTNDDDNTEVDTSKKFPIFELTEMETDVIQCSANIEITDDDDLLSSDTTVSIVERGTNKTVYENKFTQGIYNISVLTENLKPDTEYTLIANASYTYENETYNKDYISQVFSTESLGISFKKNYLSTSEISILVQVQNYSTITDGDLVLYNDKGEIVATETISISAAKLDPEYNLTFGDLANNSTYTVKLENLIYDSSVVMDFEEVSQKLTTLKIIPTLGNVNATVNKNTSSVLFSMELPNSQNGVLDPDKGITKVEYEIYQTSQITEDGKINSDPIKKITKDNVSSIDTPIDGEVLKRKVQYTYRVITYFNDNEKIVELKTGFSNPFSLDSEAYPTVRFDIEEDDEGNQIGLKHDSVKGTIVISDESRIIKRNTYVNWSIAANDGGKAKSGRFYYDDSNDLVIPINVQNLKKNTSYFISVTATIKDESISSSNQYQEVYIGGSRFTTPEPDAIKVSLDIPDQVDYTQAFDYHLKMSDITDQISSAYSVSTLKNIELYLYPEDKLTGTYNKAQISNNYPVDDPDQYNYDNNTITENLYDNSLIITPKTFSLTSQDIVEKYYTLVVKNAVDYTNHQNEVGLIKNGETSSEILCSFKITPHGFIPNLPEKPDQALDVNTILNIDTQSGNQYYGMVANNPSLKSDTIVGFDVLAKTFPTTSIQYAKSVTYRIYRVAGTNEATDSLIKENTINVTDTTATTLPHWIIDMGDPNNKDIKRGEQYYFTYSVRMDLSKDGSDEYSVVYPTDAEGGKDVILKSQVINCPKESPVIRSVLTNTDAGKNQTWLYSIQDTDNTFTSESFIATDGTKVTNPEWKVEDNTTGLYTLTVKGVSSTSLFKIEKGYSLYNRVTKDNAITSSKTYTLLNQPMLTNMAPVSNATYSIDITSSKLLITLKDFANYSNIPAIKAVISSNKSSSKVTIDYLPIDSTGQASISLMEIKDFLGSEITVDIDAYYPTTLSGTNIANTQNVFIMQKYKISDGYKYVNGSSTSAASTNAMFYMSDSHYNEFINNYIKSIQSNVAQTFKVQQVINKDGSSTYSKANGKTSEFSFLVDRQGLNSEATGNLSVDASQYYYFTQLTSKQITSPNKTAKFDFIVPEVSSVKITPELVNATVKFTYDGIDKSVIKDNKIYLQLVDKEGKDTGVKPIEIVLDGSNFKGSKEVSVPNLVEGKDYWFKLYVEFEYEGSTIQKSLVDNGQSSPENPIYSFKTVNNINLKAPSTSSYIFKNISFNDKSMNFNFNVSYATGYTMSFVLKDTTTNNEINLGEAATKTTFITTGVNTHTLDVGIGNTNRIPGANQLVYGNTYSLECIATTASGTVVGNLKIDFVLKKLDEPSVYVSTKTDIDQLDSSKAKIDYTITLNDSEFAITNKQYIVTVYKGEKESGKTPVKEQVVTLAEKQNTSATIMTLTGLDKNQVYTVYIQAKIRTDYNSHDIDFVSSYKTTTINEFGLSMGKTYVEVVKDTSKTYLKLDLYDTVGFSKIKRVNYTIINLSTGKAEFSQTDEVIKTETTNNITTIKLNKDIAALKNGRYGLSIQYLDDSGSILASDTSLEFSVTSSLVKSILSFFGLE